jgi:hypothetical protein
MTGASGWNNLTYWNNRGRCSMLAVVQLHRRVMEKGAGHAAADQPVCDTYPCLQRLYELRNDGWRFQSVLIAGDLELLAGARSWPDGWSDAIAIRDLTDAKAFRCDPDGGEVWLREGGLVDVVDALIELPAPDQPSAPRLVRARAPQLWTPGNAMVIE